MTTTYNKLQELYEYAKEHTPSWYKNFDSTEAIYCLKGGVSKTSSLVASTVSYLDSKVQEMLGQDDTHNDGDL